MKLTDYYIRRRISALSKEAALRPHNYCSLSDAKSILLLFQSEDEELIDVCVKKLKDKNIKVVVGLYSKISTRPESWDNSYFVVDMKSNLNMFYYPDEATNKHFRALQVDMLIDLTHNDCYAMQYLLLQHPCRFKVGIHGRFPIYDMEFFTSKDIDISSIFDQMLFYLQIIRSK